MSGQDSNSHIPDDQPHLIISVESRKGGVGKTTAALCLARLLLERGYAVLFLDLDVTGTNAADIADSPFWREELHIIRQSKGNNSDTPLNLISLFEEYFMAGKGFPELSLTYSSDTFKLDLKKVNLIGSQIYNIDPGSDKKTTVSIQQIGILFDDLYTLWFLEFVQQICDKFRAISENNKCAIILDNSPGYVGVAPAINEWLTDCGPKCGKFLIVTSLDIQDLRTCERAIDVLHGLYKGKLETSQRFHDGSECGGEFHLERHQEAFFIRLASMEIAQGKKDPLAYYKASKVLDNNYYCQPKSYIAAIINRVPRAIKTGNLSYDLQPLQGSILAQLLGDIRQRLDCRDWMVSYDEYIENQFLLVGSLKRKRRNHKPRLTRLIDSLIMAEKEFQPSVEDIYKNPFLLTKMNYIDFKQLKSHIEKANDIVLRARTAVADAGLEHIARLVHEEWLPGSIVPNFRSLLTRILRECDLPYFNKLAPFEYDMGPVSEFVDEFKKFILMDSNLFRINNNNVENGNINIVMTNLLAMLSSLSINYSFWYSNRETIYSLFSAILKIQLTRWKKRNTKWQEYFDIQNFFAREAVAEFTFLGYTKEIISIQLTLRKLRMDLDSFSNFYKACALAQARLIDYAADSQFLIKLLRWIVTSELDKGDIFPFIRGIAEDIIIKKTVPHEKEMEIMERALKTAEYFSEFDDVLKRVLNNWEIRND